MSGPTCPPMGAWTMGCSILRRSSRRLFGQTAVRDSVPCARSSRNLPLVVYDCSERWAKMCEHEVLRAHALCHGAQIGCQALAIEGSRRKTAALVRPHDGVERRVHDDVRPLRQFLHLRGCRGSAWWG